jgi:hypothetical protein
MQWKNFLRRGREFEVVIIAGFHAKENLMGVYLAWVGFWG